VVVHAPTLQLIGIENDAHVRIARCYGFDGAAQPEAYGLKGIHFAGSGASVQGVPHSELAGEVGAPAFERPALESGASMAAPDCNVGGRDATNRLQIGAHLAGLVSARRGVVLPKPTVEVVSPALDLAILEERAPLGVLAIERFDRQPRAQIERR
jgi:hypothetical protein